MRKNQVTSIVEATLNWIDVSAIFNLSEDDSPSEKEIRQKLTTSKSELKKIVMKSTMEEVAQACKELGTGPSFYLKKIIDLSL